MDSNTFLYAVSPLLMERLCEMVDSGGDRFGWRALAARIFPSWSELRLSERREMAGQSPTRELLWSWAQQNTRVQDLLRVLQDMGHYRALQLFQGPPQQSALVPSRAESTGLMSAAEDSVLREESPMSHLNSAHLFTFQDIVEWTRDFHRDMRIAEGHFSDMYRAQNGNKTFAVKLFKQVNKGYWKISWDMFRKEMEVHHLYQHPNILDLLGCCSDESRYCLIYPYLPNGSLYSILHQNSELPLSWPLRLTIIKGLAKALHHFHTAQPCSVICGNISSTNILLDDGLQPKLSDFGLARLRPHSPSQHCTITMDMSSHSNQGYLPEEYIRDGKLSCSLDVYSFGMVVMETVTGQTVTEEMSKHRRLRDVLAAEMDNSGGVDSCLQFVDGSAGQWPPTVALCLLGLAMDCTVSRQRNRPSMQSVLQVLSRLLPLPTCPPGDQLQRLYDGASTPVEHFEHQSPSGCDPAVRPLHSGPFECSQSEVTFRSDAVASGEDLCGSWPVEVERPACEDQTHTEAAHSDMYVVENTAKQRLRKTLSAYNRGLIDTEELEPPLPPTS